MQRPTFDQSLHQSTDFGAGQQTRTGLLQPRASGPTAARTGLGIPGRTLLAWVMTLSPCTAVIAAQDKIAATAWEPSAGRFLAWVLTNTGLGMGALVAICASVVAAYVIFGLAGFGTALVAGPVLAHFIDLATVVPLLALLDFAAAGTNLARDGRAADLSELRRIVPAMALGSLAGAAILLLGRPQMLLLCLGFFAVGYGLYSLSGYKPDTRWPARAALPFGLVGGVFSALFGSGGFIYSIYLAGRLEAPERIRVTQSALIGLSTLTRAVLFLLAGVYADTRTLVIAALLVPAMLVGTAVGRRITLTLSRLQFLRIVSAIVLCSGLALIVRYVSGQA